MSSCRRRKWRKKSQKENMASYIKEDVDDDAYEEDYAPFVSSGRN